MKKKGFISMYLVYSFFLLFIVLSSSILFINHYKTNLLNALKNDTKTTLSTYKLDFNRKNEDFKDFNPNLLDIEN